LLPQWLHNRHDPVHTVAPPHGTQGPHATHVHH